MWLTREQKVNFWVWPGTVICYLILLILFVTSGCARDDGKEKPKPQSAEEPAKKAKKASKSYGPGP